MTLRERVHDIAKWTYWIQDQLSELCPRIRFNTYTVLIDKGYGDEIADLIRSLKRGKEVNIEKEARDLEDMLGVERKPKSPFRKIPVGDVILGVLILLVLLWWLLS